MTGRPPPSSEFWKRLAAARKRLLLLDYDGTLAPFRVDRARARPAPGVMPALRRIQRGSAAEVVIVSGRPAEELVPLLGKIDVEIVGGTARALARALDLPLEERARRQAALLAHVEAQTAARWAESFDRDLVGVDDLARRDATR